MTCLLGALVTTGDLVMVIMLLSCGPSRFGAAHVLAVSCSLRDELFLCTVFSEIICTFLHLRFLFLQLYIISYRYYILLHSCYCTKVYVGEGFVIGHVVQLRRCDWPCGAGEGVVIGRVLQVRRCDWLCGAGEAL